MLSPQAGLNTIRLWDGPIRVVHWSFVMLLGAMWWSAEKGEMTLHKQLGMIFLSLLVFRLLWGVFGSSTARFSQFVKAPSAVLRYLTDRDSSRTKTIGHNPLGALSVVILLSLLVLQVGLGLITQDVDALETGPLNHLVSYDTAEVAREWHEFLFNYILAVVAVHVLAIIYYLFVKRDNLVTPMISGRKVVDIGTASPLMGSRMALVLCAAVAFGFTGWIWLGAPPL